MCEPRTCLRGLPPGFPTPPPGPAPAQGKPAHVLGGLPSDGAEPTGVKAWALGPRMPPPLYFCVSAQRVIGPRVGAW